MPTTTTRLSGLCLAGTLAACVADEPKGTDPCSTLPGRELQVGTSDSEGTGFVPFEDGDEVGLYTLGQGAFHVFVSYAARGFDPAGLYVHRSVAFAASGEVITHNPERVNLLEPVQAGPDTQCTLRTAQIAVVCPTILGRVWDSELEIVVEIEDAEGQTAKVTRYLRAHCPEGDDNQACLSICDGIPVE